MVLLGIVKCFTYLWVIMKKDKRIIDLYATQLCENDEHTKAIELINLMITDLKKGGLCNLCDGEGYIELSSGVVKIDYLCDKKEKV